MPFVAASLDSVWVSLAILRTAITRLPYALEVLVRCRVGFVDDYHGTELEQMAYCSEALVAALRPTARSTPASQRFDSISALPSITCVDLDLR